MNSLNDSLDECKKINFNTKSLQSYEKYLQRLKTFELFKWFSKPVEFSPIECARHGWINLTKDTLKCVICSNLFYFYTQSPLNRSQNETEQVKRAKNILADPRHLIEKHKQNCPWRALTVSDQLIQVDVYDPEKVMKNYYSSHASYKFCNNLPILVDNVNNSFKSLINSYSSSKVDKNKTITILSASGWIYNKDKNILECEKCLRSIGLWLYRTDHANNDDDDEQQTNIAEKEYEDIFGNEIESYSDDIVVKNILTKMINSIEVEEETCLKNVYFIDKCKTSDSATSQKTPAYDTQMSANDLINITAKKRKLNEISNYNENENLSTLGEREKRKKKFDPINEHFNWCPWLKTFNYQMKSIICPESNVCQIVFEIVHQYSSKHTTQKDCKENSILKSNVNVNSNKNLTADELLEKVKSAQSILINCTSQLLSK